MVLAPPASAHHDGAVPPCEDVAGSGAQATCDAALVVIPDPGTLDTVGLPECPLEQSLVDHTCRTLEEPDPDALPADPPGGGSGASGAANTFSVENQQNGPVVAGDDLPVAALIYSNCVPSALVTCGKIRVTLRFTTISGQPLELPQEYDHAASQRAAFVIPGEHVHWWNTQTREPYVFGYWYEATQLQGGVPVRVRAPIADNTMYEREVQHVLEMQLGVGGGPQLADASYELRVQRIGDVGATVASGVSSATGFVRFAIPSTGDVLAAAEENGGLANFMLVAARNGGCIDPVMFSANFGSPEVPATRDKAPRGATPVNLDCTETCQNRGAPETVEPIPENPHGWRMGGYHVLNASYGTRQTVIHEKRTLSRFTIAYRHPGGNFSESEAQYAIHNDSGQEWGKSLPEGFRDQASTVTATVRTGLSGTRSRYEVVANDTEDPDDCYVTERIYWDRQVGRSGQDLVNLETNYAVNDCRRWHPTGSPPCESLATRGRLLDANFTAYSTGGGGGISGAVCYLGICASGGMERSEITKVMIESNGKCHENWYYSRGPEEPLTTAQQFYMDAGDLGAAINPSTGVPKGCNP